VLRWRTGAETQLLGFNVYRGATKPNRSLVAARGSAAGSAYRFVDRAVRSGTAYGYRLQAVGRDGTRTWVARARSAPVR
jgi:hypothetical protein